MSKLCESHEVDRSNLQCEFFLFSPASMNQIDTAKNQSFSLTYQEEIV